MEASISIAYSPNGKMFATNGGRTADGGSTAVRLWDSTTYQLKSEFVGTVGSRVLAFSPDGNQIATGGSRTVNLWDVNTGEQTAVLNGHTEPIQTIDYSPS